MSAIKKDLSYYLALSYPYEVTPCPEGGYFARHPDLDGCATQAETVEEAMVGLQAARELWLASQIVDDAKIPEPPNEGPSGRLMLRVPLSLHSTLERSASEFGLSLNRLLNEVLFNHAKCLPLEYGLKRPSANASQEVSSLEYYLALRYPITLTPSEEGDFLAEHLDLPGCSAQGESAAEAVAELDVARALWLTCRHEDGLTVPEPLPLDHTGIIGLRMPGALHYDLVRSATRNGVSLNQWLVMALSQFASENLSRKRLHSKQGRVFTESGHETNEQLTMGLQREPRALNHRPLKSPAKNRADFLTGLRLLEKRAFLEAFECFSDAYRGGLNFSTTAVELYHSMPDPMSPRQLHNLLLELSQIVPGNPIDKREVHFLLVTWLEEIKEEQYRQEAWLAYDREERALAVA